MIEKKKQKSLLELARRLQQEEKLGKEEALNEAFRRLGSKK